MTSKKKTELYAHLLERTTDLKVDIKDFTGVREPRERREFDIGITITRGDVKRHFFAPSWAEAYRLVSAMRTLMDIVKMTHPYIAVIDEIEAKEREEAKA